jgi:hypothetical protein
MLEGGRQGQNGQLLAEEEGDGVGIEAVGFSAAARAGAGEVPDLEGGEAVKAEMGAWRTQEMGLQEGGVGAGGFQAHPPEVGLEGVPGGEEALPAGEVVGEGLEVGLLDGAREGVHDQESGGEGVFGHIQTDEALPWHRSPPAGEADGACGEEVRKDGGPLQPNLPVHWGSWAQATHRGWKEAGEELLEGASLPTSMAFFRPPPLRPIFHPNT